MGDFKCNSVGIILRTVSYLHEFDAGLEWIVEPEQQQEVLLHRQQLSQLRKKGRKDRIDDDDDKDNPAI